MDALQFNRVLNSLVLLFMEDRPLLESRGALIIRKLCSLLDSSSIYMTMAKILGDKADLDFVSLMVQTLNLILLTAPELQSLRHSLKGTTNANTNTNTNAITKANTKAHAKANTYPHA